MSNELKIGITILVATMVAFVGYSIMKDIPLFRTSTTIYTTFDQVYGLISGNVVNVKGFKIGSVKQMRLLESDSTIVAMNIEEGYGIPKGSYAVLKSSGVLGGKYIEIYKSDSDELVPHGGSIKGVFEQGMMDTFAEEGAKLSTDISASIRGVEELVSSLNETLNKKNKESISGTISNLESATGSLSELIQNRQNDLDSMIIDAKSTLQNLDNLSSENKEKLTSLINNLEATSAELETLSNGLNETNLTLNEVLTKINDGQGSLGKMVNDPSLYNNIDSLSVNLNQLIKNINDNPGQYLKHMRLIEVF
ncbi:MAG: MlaD family protein [Balneolaceae bacterium]